MTQVITVSAKAHAKENKVIYDKESDSYKVWVKTAPEKGKANEAIRKILALHFGLPASAFVMISGAQSKNKKFRISR